MDLPIYKNKQVNPDGAVCVDVSRLNVVATICSYGKSADGAAGSNGFFKYKDLSLEHVRQVPLLADEAFVYSEGGYGFLYPTNKKRIGDFIAYEVVNVLCKGGSEGRERPATCYVAALVLEGDVNMNPTVFVFSIVDQPPTSDGNISKQAVRKIGVINSIIRSIKVYR